jgi:hypothetical protein
MIPRGYAVAATNHNGEIVEVMPSWIRHDDLALPQSPKERP